MSFDNFGNYIPEFPDEDYIGSSNVPETQPSQPASSSSSRRQRATTRRQWTAVEDVRLCQAWINVSTDKIVGNEQSGGAFWKRVGDTYYTNLPEGWVNTRTSENIRYHFGDLSARVKLFQSMVNFEHRLNRSGRNEADVIKAAEESYLASANKPFRDHHAFYVLKDQPKWLVKIGQKSVKKQKSNEGTSIHTHDDIDDEIDNYVEETSMPERPAGRKAAKKAAAGGSSRGTGSSDPALLGMFQDLQQSNAQSKTTMDRMAAASEQKARAKQDEIDYKIMEMNPNDPDLTEDRRAWILLKQSQALARARKYGDASSD